MILKAHSFSHARPFSLYFSTPFSRIGFRSHSWTVDMFHGYWSNHWVGFNDSPFTNSFGRSIHWSRNI